MLDKKDYKQCLYSLSPLSVIPLGIKESVNPFALSSFLIFILLLIYSGRNLSRCLKNGFLFIMVIMVCNFISVFDVPNNSGISIAMNNAIFLINWVIAILMIIVGAILFVDWIKFRFMKRKNVSIVKIPFFVSSVPANLVADNKKEKISMSKGLISCIFIIFLGVAASLNNTTWVHDSGIYPVFLSLFSSVKYIQLIMAFFVYDVAFVLPMLLVLLIISVLMYNKKFCLVKENTISLIRVILSAVYLAEGFGLIYIMLS